MKNLSENYVALFEDDDIDPKEYDYEGNMAKSQLITMADAAEELHDMLDDKENLPEWCQNKIAKATDYIDSVRDYMIAAKSDDIDDEDDDDKDVKEAINHADAHTDAQQHSNGSMSVKKIPSMLKKPGDKHLHLHMKSYHKEKDGQAFAKKHGYKVSNYVKTGAGSRMNIHKESAEVSEGFESEVLKILDKKGIDGYFKNNALYVSRRDVKDAKKALKKAINIYKLPKIVGEGYTYENFKQSIDGDIIKEKLKPSMGIGSYIKDFSKSDAPQFKGKSEKERRDMAVAAYLSAKRGDK